MLCVVAAIVLDMYVEGEEVVIDFAPSTVMLTWFASEPAVANHGLGCQGENRQCGNRQSHDCNVFSRSDAVDVRLRFGVKVREGCNGMSKRMVCYCELLHEKRGRGNKQ
jgi:hypothetical protein